MAQHKTKEEHKEAILKLIEKEEIHEISYITAAYGMSREWFYSNDFHKDDTIREACEAVRIKRKKKLLKNWNKEDAAPVLQISAFRLMATDEEHRKLTQKQIDHTSGGEPITKIEIVAPSQRKDG